MPPVYVTNQATIITEKAKMLNPLPAKKLHVVRLTPPGRGAVASLLLSGPGADEAFRNCWTGRNVDDLEVAKPYFGRFRLADTDLLEEIVVHRSRADEIEIHCHGGDRVVAALESALVRHGVEPISWIEMFCSGENQTDQQERALRMLPFARSERTAQILLDQYNGAFERESAEIDLLGESRGEIEEKRRRLERLEENAVVGHHLIEPFRVVLAGPTNAGKSSLFNAILGFQRTIVDPTPGTTRDVVSAETAIEGFPVVFLDTAGFRTTDHDLEQQGIERSRQMLDQADLIVWVEEIQKDIQKNENKFSPPMQNAEYIYCFNKMDLVPKELGQDDSTVFVSALTGEGIENLLEKIIRRLVPNPPKPLEAVPLR